MSFISNFKENNELRKKYNTAIIDLMVAQEEIKRYEIVVDELKEAVASVRKIWIDANNEKELKIVELNNIINNLKGLPKKKKESK